MSERVAAIDNKIVIVSDKLNLMIDGQTKLTEIHNKYRYNGPNGPWLINERISYIMFIYKTLQLN